MLSYQQGATQDASDRDGGGGGAPGKRTLTGGLPPRLAAHASARLGHDFSSVTVHQDGSAERLGTSAYARGDALHFAAGAYQPGTAAGVQMIGHELGHVAQQRSGQVQATGARGGVAVNTDPALERAADAAGASVAQGFDFDAAFDFGTGPTSAGAGAGIAQGADLTPDAESRTVTGGGGYKYQQFANGDITIVGGPKKVGVSYPAGDPVNAAITKELEDTYGPFPPPAAAAPAPAPSGAGPTGIPTLDAIIATVASEASAIGDQAAQTKAQVVDAGAALLASMTSMVFDMLNLGTTSAPPTTVPAAPRAAPSDPTAVDPNLAAAKQLADELSIPHGYDHDGLGKNGANETVIVDPLQEGARREAIVAGDPSQMKTILCSEFTNLTLARAGIDLNQHYRSADGKAVVYADKHGPTFVTLYMVTNFQPEATAAVLAVQHGTAELVAVGSARAKELGIDGETFYYSTATTFVGGDLAQGDQFGGAATAVSLGGKAIAPADRRPGDLQQSADVQGGKAAGKGHSSQIWTVRGPGVACLGQPGSPKVSGLVKSPGPVDTLSGWYEIPEGSKLAWELAPETDPAQVARLTCVSYQLIEANTGKAGDDATAVGGLTRDKSTQVVSDGRLPDSKWIDDAPRAVEIVGTLA